MFFINRFFGRFTAKSQNKLESNLRLIYNKTAQKGSISGEFPKVYEEGVWGPNMMSCYHIISGNNIIYSFPASHSIYSYNFVNNIQIATEFKSRLFEFILPMNSKSVNSFKARNEYFLTQPSYGPIIFDEYRNLYYRVAYHPISNDDLLLNDPQKSRIKQTSIVVTDDNFNFITETVLLRFDYTETMFFVNSEGLHLAKWSKSKMDEANLYFDVFKLVNNK